jgi:predicted PurR-regulated permease PerM
MDQLNHWLSLDPDESELFLKYRAGYNGEMPIEDRFYDYFQANQTTSTYTMKERDPAALKLTGAPSQAPSPEASVEKSKIADEFSIWILAPLIFIFLGFDNGQMRRYFISLVPNRYFELSLTVLDMLDDAIGKYLRGTLMECFLVGFTLAFGLFLLGIPLSVAVAIGVVSGLVNAIPFLGTVIGLIIGLGYALIAENVSPVLPGLNPDDLAIYVVVLVGIAHVLDNVVFQPFVLGSAVNVHPLVVMIAIMSGSLLMGLWGMLFAIPTVVVVKTAVETLFKELKDYRII